MPWLFGAAALLVAGIVLWRFGRRPVFHRGVTFASLARHVDSFLLQMAPGGVLIAERESGPGFLQLAMISASLEWQAVEFGLPELAWSRHRFDEVVRGLQHAGFETRVEATASPNLPRFLRVSLSGPTPEVSAQAFRLLQSAHRELGWNASERYTVHSQGALRASREVIPS